VLKIASYTVDQVFTAMDAQGTGILPDGTKFRKGSARLILFRTKGTKCVTCGLNGTVFVLETHDAAVRPHLNLYGQNSRGQMVLLTKDHIKPKSKGGPDEQENFNPMCSPCNNKKADKVR
jgi:5-methylcytosine-specific restriction endonuclease McrA